MCAAPRFQVAGMYGYISKGVASARPPAFKQLDIVWLYVCVARIWLYVGVARVDVAGLARE